MNPITLRLDPLDLAQYRESLQDLEHMWGRMFAEHKGQARFLSHVHPVTYARLRQALRRKALQLQTQDDDPWAWSWPWLLNQELMFERMEQKVPPLTVTHYGLFWSDEPPDILAQNVKASLQLPDVAFATLPAFVPGRYHERATQLHPAEEGLPWLAVLAGYEVLGRWDPRSWLSLLLGDVPLALCIDVDTLTPEDARSECITTYNRMWTALHGPQRVLIDQDAKGALATVEYVLDEIGKGETLHRVRYLVMVVAATRDDLQANIAKVRTTLGGMVRLDQLPGAQAEWIKFFSPIATADIHQKPLPWGTLSYGVGTKLPVGARRSLREQGVCLGVSGLGLPVVREPWRDAQGNAHAVYLGTTGGGKTTGMLTQALRWASAAQDACQVVYVDPIGKGRLLVDAASDGGRFIEVEKDAAIHPLDRVTPNLRDQLYAVRRKLSMILGHTETRGGKSYLHPRRFSEHEWPALDLALQATYGELHAPRLSDLLPRLRHVIDTENMGVFA